MIHWERVNSFISLRAVPRVHTPKQNPSCVSRAHYDWASNAQPLAAVPKQSTRWPTCMGRLFSQAYMPIVTLLALLTWPEGKKQSLEFSVLLNNMENSKLWKNCHRHLLFQYSSALNGRQLMAACVRLNCIQSTFLYTKLFNLPMAGDGDFKFHSSILYCSIDSVKWRNSTLIRPPPHHPQKNPYEWMQARPNSQQVLYRGWKFPYYRILAVIRAALISRS